MIPGRVRQDFERSIIHSVIVFNLNRFSHRVLWSTILSFVLFSAIYITGMLPPLYNKRMIFDESQARIDSLLASRSPIYSGQDPFEADLRYTKESLLPLRTRVASHPDITNYCSIVTNLGYFFGMDLFDSEEKDSRIKLERRILYLQQ